MPFESLSNCGGIVWVLIQGVIGDDPNLAVGGFPFGLICMLAPADSFFRGSRGPGGQFLHVDMQLVQTPCAKVALFGTKSTKLGRTRPIVERFRPILGEVIGLERVPPLLGDVGRYWFEVGHC